MVIRAEFRGLCSCVVVIIADSINSRLLSTCGERDGVEETKPLRLVFTSKLEIKSISSSTPQSRFKTHATTYRSVLRREHQVFCLSGQDHDIVYNTHSKCLFDTEIGNQQRSVHRIWRMWEFIRSVSCASNQSTKLLFLTFSSPSASFCVPETG